MSTLRWKAHSAKSKLSDLLPKRPKPSSSVFLACGRGSIHEAWLEKESVLLEGGGYRVYEVKKIFHGQEVVVKVMYGVRSPEDVPEIEQEVQNLHKVQQLAINGYGYGSTPEGKTVYVIVMKNMGNPLSKIELKLDPADLRRKARKEYGEHYGLVMKSDLPQDYVYREEMGEWKAHPINWAYAVSSGHKPSIKVPDIDYCIEHW